MSCFTYKTKHVKVGKLGKSLMEGIFKLTKQSQPSALNLLCTLCEHHRDTDCSYRCFLEYCGRPCLHQLRQQ
ncbi:hypothetical protein GMA8713_04704 [Grimontia marina]|uniref:Uncharacterized protein n=1 Tax=Grimontia marina TaxID=646534 RepID=A0A128FKA0_9GAMM|nr:hypothetical protein GMA8713_04704 [Grimontia marina]